MLAVRREHTVEAREVDPGFEHQGDKPGDKVQRLEDDMRGAIAGRRLDARSAHVHCSIATTAFPTPRVLRCSGLIVPIYCARAPWLRHPRAEGIPLPCRHGQRTAHCNPAGCLQREHLAARVRPHCDAVGARVAQELIQQSAFHSIASQIAVLGIAFE
jgi:hypothetical protein